MRSCALLRWAVNGMEEAGSSVSMSADVFGICTCKPNCIERCKRPENERSNALVMYGLLCFCGR